jgi:hypothetical protein
METIYESFILKKINYTIIDADVNIGMSFHVTFTFVINGDQ